MKNLTTTSLYEITMTWDLQTRDTKQSLPNTLTTILFPLVLGSYQKTSGSLMFPAGT